MSLDLHTPSQDHYAVLGVPTTASPAEIRWAYRRLCLRYHPDLHDVDPTVADQQMKAVNAAAAVLLDPHARADHDQQRALRASRGKTSPLWVVAAVGLVLGSLYAGSAPLPSYRAPVYRAPVYRPPVYRPPDLPPLSTWSPPVELPPLPDLTRDWRDWHEEQRRLRLESADLDRLLRRLDRAEGDRPSPGLEPLLEQPFAERETHGEGGEPAPVVREKVPQEVDDEDPPPAPGPK